MDLHNRTRFPAMLFRGIIRGDRMFGSLATRITYDLVGEELWPASEQPWPINPAPWDSPQGPLDGDNLFYRGGVDLFFFGSAVAPQGKPVSRMDVKFTVGKEFKQSLAIFGDRVWEKKGKEYVASAPKPFTALPLTMAHAFGGVDIWDELPIPFPSNPEGKGFRLFEETVPGTPLPNIEHPDRLLTHWKQAPEPAGCAAPPASYPVKAVRFVEFDMQTGEMKKLDPKFFNSCFPDMIVPELLLPGSKVRVDGVRKNGPLAFVLPANPTTAKVCLDDYSYNQNPWVDQIGIDEDASQVFVTYRFPFRYTIVPLEKRWAELLPSAPAFAAVAG